MAVGADRRWATRLISRIRETYPPLFSLRTFYAVVAGTGDIVMVRRQLRGIKARAEWLARAAGQPGQPATTVPAEVFS